MADQQDKRRFYEHGVKSAKDAKSVKHFAWLFLGSWLFWLVGGIVALVIFLYLLTSYPKILVCLVGIGMILFIATRLAKAKSVKHNSSASGLVLTATVFLVVAGAAVAYFLMPVLFYLVIAVVIGAVLVWLWFSNRAQQRRRLTPFSMSILEVALPEGVKNSEQATADFDYQLSKRQELGSKDRKTGRGTVVRMQSYTKPDPHGLVQLRTYLLCHPDYMTPRQLEAAVQRENGGDASIFPVAAEDFDPAIYTKRWQISQGEAEDPYRHLLDIDEPEAA